MAINYNKIKMSTDKSQPRKYIVLDHDTDIKYEVTEHHQEEPKPNPNPVNTNEIPKGVATPKEKAAELYKEGKLYREPPMIVSGPVAARRKELEELKKKWDQYYKDNQGKIPDEFPKTIFDNAKTK